MKRKLMALTTTALLAVTTVRAEEHKGHGPGPFEGPLIPPRLLGELALIDQQKPKVEALQAEFDKKRDDLRAAHKDAPDAPKLREEMKTAQKAGDQAKMKQLREQMREQAQPFVDLRRQYMDKVRALLTDEQKHKLDEARQRFARPGPPPPPPDKPGKPEED